MKEKMLVLENGKVFRGYGFGSDGTVISEIVFNTSMVGYQEILSDPSYYGQMVVMTYPLIGNYGLADEDYESKSVYMSGLIVREYNDNPSNFRFTRTLGAVMHDYNVSGICGVDTRAITRIIRDEGAMKSMITDASRSIEACLKELKEWKRPVSPVSAVTCKNIWYARTRNPKFTVVAVDCGIQLSMIRRLNENGCNVIVVPFDTPCDIIDGLNPDGIFISDGPGSPEEVPSVMSLIKWYKGKKPIAAIGLGHQATGLAYGAKLVKLKLGHRGASQPVKNLETDRVEIAAQNHSYTLDKASLANTGLTVTHINLIDGDVEGTIDKTSGVITLQYLPDASANHGGKEFTFDSFIEFMQKAGENTNAKKNRY